MKTETIKATDLVGAIHDAFRGSDACHCEEDGKLSEDELMRLLAMREIIPATLLSGPLSVTIAEISDGWSRTRHMVPHDRRLPETVVRQLRGKVRFLHELTGWTYGDLLALGGVGPRAVEQTERAMAAFGFLLKDGDPALLEPEPEPEITAEAHTADPDKVRETCSEGLMQLATEMARDASTLIRFASKMGADDTRVSGLLKKYAQRYKQTNFQKVLRVAGPWIAMVDSKRARKKPARKQSQGKRAAVPALTEGNVVHAAFGR